MKMEGGEGKKKKKQEIDKRRDRENSFCWESQTAVMPPMDYGSFAAQ